MACAGREHAALIERFRRARSHREQAVERARDLWRRWRERGMALTYWQQTERGWQKAAPAGPEP